MGDEHLSTILETESDELIKSIVENLVQSQIFSDFNNDCTSSDDDSFEDIDCVEASPPDSELVSLEEVKDDILHEKLLNINLLIACDLPSSNNFSPISIFEEKSVTFSNLLFNSNDDFTSSDNESLSDKDVLEDVKIYSNPLFEFDDEYISSDVNPLFDVVLEDIECKDSYDTNLDESTFLVTPLSDSNKDECLTPSDDIELLLHHDPSISVVSILKGFTNELPLEENDDLFYLESKENDWKKILYDALIDDLITEDKVFDPGIYEIIFSPTYGSLPFEDHHHFSFTYVIRTFLPYFTYLVNSLFPLSSESEDIIFDPDISAFHFSSLNLVAYECPMEVFSSTYMELESRNSGPTAKLPILKLGEYEMWAIRIKKYFQIQDYALWEVIENGDSWVSISQTSQENGIIVTKMFTPTTAEENTNKKNDVKAMSLLLMALPNEHYLTFSQYLDAKSMFAAIETRFGGNATTKKAQKTLLKQQYKNFSATSTESLDSIFNRL
ncbi:hypothetical protein Tco_0981862 [Tanacetum coccineum]